MNIRSSTLVVAAIAVAVIVAASSARRPAPEPAIVVVDLQAVIEGLDELDPRHAAREEKFAKHADHIDALNKQLADLDQKLEVATDEQKPTIESERLVVGRALQALFESTQRLVKEDEAADYTSLSNKVIDAARELADQSGYALVLADDQAAPKAEAGTVGQVLALRRVIYASERHDITQELIDYMNNRYAAAQ